MTLAPLAFKESFQEGLPQVPPRHKGAVQSLADLGIAGLLFLVKSSQVSNQGDSL